MWSSERARRGGVAAAVLVALASAGMDACAQEATAPAAAPAPPPPAASRAPRPPRPRGAFETLGASLFAFPYLASAISATTAYSPDDSTSSSRTVMWVPIVGPFVMAGSTHSGAADALLVLDGLAQAAGITLFVYGLAAPRPVVVSVAPLVDRTTAGAGLVGRF